MTEEQKREWAALEERLMPSMGKAETVAGEIVRAADRIWHRWYNDGDRINVGYGKETCNGTARYLEKVRGADFPSEVWNGSLGDDAYAAFADGLVEEMLALVKTRPELETTPNAEDSRTDFIDEDLDREEADEEETEF